MLWQEADGAFRQSQPAFLFTPLNEYFSESQGNVNEVKIVDDLVKNADDCCPFSTDGAEFRTKSERRTTFENLFFSSSGLINDAF